MSAGADARQADELRINEDRDIAYQRNEWVAQRIAWLVMLALVLAALIGLLGAPGVIGTERKAASDGSIGVEYDRISRFHAPTQLIIEVAPEFVEEGQIRLWLGEAYAGELSIESIVPEPDSAEVGPDGVVYVFLADDSGGPLQITIRYQHDNYWRAKGAIGLTNGERITFTQIVLP